MIGIYTIKNNINNKLYVGQSWDINKRIYEHKHCEHNKHLQRAYDKYGIDNFEFSVIKEIHESPLTQIFLDVYEDHYITAYKTINNEYGYNKRYGGSRGKFSEESKELLRKSLTGIKKTYSKDSYEKMCLSRKGRIPWNKGKKEDLSIETRTKLSELARNRNPPMKGKKHNEETIIKMRKAKIGKVSPMKGRQLSSESKNKMSSAKKGKVPWNKGLKVTIEIRKKLSDSHKGIKNTEEQKKKISESMKKVWKCRSKEGEYNVN